MVIRYFVHDLFFMWIWGNVVSLTSIFDGRLCWCILLDYCFPPSPFCVYNSTFLFISSPPLLLQVNFMGFNPCTLLLLLTPSQHINCSYESERVHTGRELKKDFGLKNVCAWKEGIKNGRNLPKKNRPWIIPCREIL